MVGIQYDRYCGHEMFSLYICSKYGLVSVALRAPFEKRLWWGGKKKTDAIHWLYAYE